MLFIKKKNLHPPPSSVFYVLLTYVHIQDIIYCELFFNLLLGSFVMHHSLVRKWSISFSFYGV